MNKGELVDYIAEDLEVSKALADSFVNSRIVGFLFHSIFMLPCGKMIRHVGILFIKLSGLVQRDLSWLTL